MDLATPPCSRDQLCFGWGKRAQIRLMLSRALVDGGVELEVDLVVA
jgi:hypothetical protein